MYRALPGDLEELGALLIAQRPVEFDVQLGRIDPSLLGFALSAIVGVDPRVLKPSGDASERQTFPLGFVIDTSTPTTASAPSCSASATISPIAVSSTCLNGFL